MTSQASQTPLDPYTAKAENNDLTPQQKIEGLHAIVKKVKIGMFTTRTADGHMHTRAMAPAGRTCSSWSRIYNGPDRDVGVCSVRPYPGEPRVYR